MGHREVRWKKLPSEKNLTLPGRPQAGKELYPMHDLIVGAVLLVLVLAPSCVVMLSPTAKAEAGV